MSQRTSHTVALCSAANFINSADRVIMPIAIIQMAKEYNWDLHGQGWVLSSFAVGYMASGILGGSASKKYGGKNTLMLAVFMWSLSTLVTPLFAHSYSTVFISRVILGIGEGLGLPTIVHIFAHTIPLEERSRAFGYLLALGSIGQTVSALDPVLINAAVVDGQKRDVSFSNLEYFLDRFPCLKKEGVSVDTIEGEFIEYQMDDSLPDSAVVGRLDKVWHSVGLILDKVTGQKKYENLAFVMKGILVIFHSNAGCEQLFTVVAKNKTSLRSSMSTDTLSNLLVHKMMSRALSSDLYHEYSAGILKKAKSATRLGLAGLNH